MTQPLIYFPLTASLLQDFEMDLNSLKDQVSNLSLYDLKAGVRKVQNGKMGQKDRRLGQAYRKICSGNELYGNGGKGKSISLSGRRGGLG